MFNGVNVAPFIVADSAFRLSPMVMKPYPFSVHNSASQRTFNYNLSKVRRVVENAFGHIKARFRRVGKGVDNQIGNANAVIKACCVLHNFLIEEKDGLNRNWFRQQKRTEKRREQAEHGTNLERNGEVAETIRQALSSYFDAADTGLENGAGSENGAGPESGDGLRTGTDEYDDMW